MRDAIKAYHDSAEYSQTKPARVKTLTKHLLKPIRTLPRTALDPAAADFLSAPVDAHIGRLLGFKRVLNEGAVFLFDAAARGTGEQAQRAMLASLERLDNHLAETDPDQDLLVALEAVLADLGSRLDADQDVSHRDWRDAEVLVQLVDRLASLEGRGDIPQLPLAQAWRGMPASVSAQFQTHLARGRRTVLRARDANRMASAGPLADRWNAVAAAARARYYQLAVVYTQYLLALATLMSGEDDYIDFVVPLAALTFQGEPLPHTQTTRWRLWKTAPLCAHIGSLEPAPKRSLRERLRWMSEGVRENEQTSFLQYVGCECAEPGVPLPWFLTIFRLDLMRGSYRLPVEIREARHALLLQAECRLPRTTPDELLDFPKRERYFARDARERGLLLIPIENFMRAMQLARTGQFVCFERGLRSGELLQIHGTLANIVKNPARLALPRHILAIPKKRGADQPREFHITRRAGNILAAMSRANRRHFGNAEAKRPLPVQRTLRPKITKPFPPLFRSDHYPLDAEDMQQLICMLLIGIAAPDIQDIRTARGKTLLDAGASLRFIQDFLGHEEVKTTRGYVKPTEAMAERAALAALNVEEHVVYLDVHDQLVAIYDR